MSCAAAAIFGAWTGAPAELPIPFLGVQDGPKEKCRGTRRSQLDS